MEKLKAIGQRLKTYLKYKRIGVNELGRLSSTSGGQISHIIHGKNYGVDKMLNIFRCQPDLNSKWILLGEGPMMNDKKIEKHIIPEDKSYLAGYDVEDLKDELLALQSKHIKVLEEYNNLLKGMYK